MSYLYILEIKPWSIPSFADILSLSVSLSFCFVYGFLCYEKACIYKLNLVPFVFVVVELYELFVYFGN